MICRKVVEIYEQWELTSWKEKSGASASRFYLVRSILAQVEATWVTMLSCFCKVKLVSLKKALAQRSANGISFLLQVVIVPESFFANSMRNNITWTLFKGYVDRVSLSLLTQGNGPVVKGRRMAAHLPNQRSAGLRSDRWCLETCEVIVVIYYNGIDF